MPAATAKKTEETKTEAKTNARGLVIGEPVPITNIQKIGVLRFHAKHVKDNKSPLADYVEIQPGETKPVPWRIWEHYEVRADVEAHDRVHFVIGDLNPGEEMKTATAQAQVLALREKDIAKRESELAQYESKLEDTRRELEALREGH